MDILFWSGGKDSYLALEFYDREIGKKEDLALLTTYEEESKHVPHQELPLKNIRRQAKHLGLSLIEVPLPRACPNETYLEKVKEALTEQQQLVERLVFGDWHLQDIREWREQVFGEMGYRCLFPIWEKSLHDLLPVLLLKPVQIKISAVKGEFQKYIKVGEAYDQAFVRTLPKEIDPMGENGEFHTEVMFEDLSKRVV
ncbi:hypothetical protein NC796_06840 [Aliifodinibius sp. S!AR15-10]|uniref:Dph6-related ATP pyrophosphatase n=1 Tax=Aliifodinibius sp. S!AR15-10 TaxID=2950437 RepID=UPI002857ED51|nr:hypothetical protein [Aliifodinibius sp. S!AR15-10]MDR8390845.1 hypothetical protein [Aliifodinibius sp. S!AR15-10]